MNIISNISINDNSQCKNLCLSECFFDLTTRDNNKSYYSWCYLHLYIGTLNENNFVSQKNSEIIKNNLDEIIRLASIDYNKKDLNKIRKNIIDQFNKNFYLYVDVTTMKKSSQSDNYDISKNKNDIDILTHILNNHLYNLGLTIDLFSADKSLKYKTLGEKPINTQRSNYTIDKCDCYFDLKKLINILINKKELYKLLEEKSSSENININDFLKYKKLLDLL